MVHSLAFTPDSKTLAVGYLNGLVRAWDLEAGKDRSPPQMHKVSVLSLAFSPDGKLLACGRGDGTVQLGDAAAKEKPAVLRGPAGRSVNCVAFNLAGRPDAGHLRA